MYIVQHYSTIHFKEAVGIWMYLVFIYHGGHLHSLQYMYQVDCYFQLCALGVALLFLKLKSDHSQYWVSTVVLTGIRSHWKYSVIR